MMIGTAHLKNMVVRFTLMVLACLCVAILMNGVMWLFADPHIVNPPLTRAPFGVGLREAGAGASGFAAHIMMWQSQFYRSLTQTLGQISEQGGMLALIGLSFAYGVFHAAGPGHGKAIISAYIVATNQQYRRGLFLSIAAAFVQACVAIALVGILALLLNQTSLMITQKAQTIEKVSYAIMAFVGLWVLWRRTQTWRFDHASEHQCGAGCAHGAVIIGDTKVLMSSVVLAAGIRPCMGAIVILVFALSQHLFWVGVLATLAMAVGTALTTGALASLAVFAKSLALSMADGRSSSQLARLFQIGIRIFEWLAAAFIVVLGVTLFTQSSLITQ